MKVNVDAAVFDDERQHAAGMMARNAAGSLLDIRSISSEGRERSAYLETKGNGRIR